MATTPHFERDYDEQSGQTIPAEHCPECSGRLKTDGGEIRCVECGLVVEACRVDRRGPRTYPDDESEKARTGAPLTEGRHDRGLSTKIGFRIDGKGNRLSDGKQRQLSRLRREHKRAKWRSKAERNLGHGCTEIARLVGALGLPQDTREQASRLFRSAQDAGLLVGRSIEAFAAATVYAVCRCTDVTRTLDEVVTVAQVSRSRITNAYRVLNTDLGLPAPPQRPRAFVPALASSLDVPQRTRALARSLAVQAWEARLSVGVNPVGFAAACLEVACRDHAVDVTQTDLAATADVSPLTIRTHRNEIEAHREEWSR